MTRLTCRLRSWAGAASPTAIRHDSGTHTLAAWLNAQEAGFLAAALQENQGNVTATARQLGISRVTLYTKLKKYGIPQLAVDTNTAAL